MIARLGLRLATEVAPLPLLRLASGMAFNGVRAVRRFRRRRAAGEHFPAFLFISITDACNLSCQGCWVSQGSPPRQLDMTTLDHIISEGRRHGISTFGILGGEPLLHQGLGELLESHPTSYFVVFTNGTLITDEVARRFRHAGNVSPLISIEGTAEVSDQRRGGSKVLERTLEGLAACTAHGLFTGVATSVCRSNLNELATREFVDEVARRKAHYLWYHIYRPVGPHPCPELALSAEQIIGLRRFLVDVRRGAPLLVVDAYWDHQGQAVCPALAGIGYHVGPGGHLEPCPPIQLASECLDATSDAHALITGSPFLAELRRRVATASPGCVLLESPELLLECARASGAVDTSGRGRVFEELAAMRPRASHHQPGNEIPESSWVYRMAKKSWFFGLGAYG